MALCRSSQSNYPREGWSRNMLQGEAGRNINKITLIHNNDKHLRNTLMVRAVALLNKLTSTEFG